MKRLAFAVLAFFLCAALRAEVKLAPLFTDNMVLQQNADVRFWGTARAGARVTLLTSWDKARYVAPVAKDGSWSLSLHTPSWGGPYTVSVSDGKGAPVVLENVLIGDVWLCGGQSNMEMAIENNVTGMARTLAEASSHTGVRIFHVNNTTALEPSSVLNVRHGGWNTCDENTIRDFSAAGYYFGIELNEKLGVPIGLIESCWGGTLAEAWTSAGSLETMPYFRDAVKRISELPSSAAERDALFRADVERWEKEVRAKDPGFKSGWATVDYDDSSWDALQAPGTVESQGLPHIKGFMWMRKTVDIPQSWAGRELTLGLSMIDDNDFAFFNGECIGHTEGWMARRQYKVPASAVTAGKAVIAVRVMDTGGDGGIHGRADWMNLSCGMETMSLAGEWKYRRAMSLRGIPLFPINVSSDPNTPTALYNAMIYPLIQFPIKGAIWYQGEANVGRAEQYQTLLPLMINDWRRSWGYCFPFYIAQLANYMTPQTEAEESSWAALREAQLMVSQTMEDTGLAVLIDIGEARDIHPKNKVDVGKRLAYNALALTYGLPVQYSGPIYKSHAIEGSAIRVRFDFASGLCSLGGDDGAGVAAAGAAGAGGAGLGGFDGAPAGPDGFYIAGVDRVFHKATALIDGETVVVSSPEVDFPVAVRYGWADNPHCTLYNGAGLPASPFRTDGWY